jgi:tetratricopeptide (TPR) repeat protein
MRTARLLTFLVLLNLPPLPAVPPLPAAAAPAADLAEGLRLFDAGRYEEARRLFEARVAATPRDFDALFHLGRTYLRLARYDDSAARLEQAVALRPGSSQAHDWLGRAYGGIAQQSNNPFKQAGLAKKVKAEFEKAVELDAGNFDARENLIRYYLQAPGFMGGSVEGARRQAAEIKRRDLYRGLAAWAMVHADQDRLDLAVQEHQAALKQSNDPRIRGSLGILYLQLERWDDAFAAFETILQANPADAQALYQLGRTGAVSGQRLDRAEECLRRYLAHTPTADEPPLAAAHHRLGMIYEKRGDKARARAAYQAALKLTPGYGPAKEALKKLG